ncbi:MAG: cell wall metabolism sensor histidine kinase WalK, partial [Lactobacillus iners]|nr:cell wall metabolism sensor histidine kinase WalK [Lactobacillus iners]
MKRIRKPFTSINAKIAIIFMLLLLATIEIVGAYFTRQLEQNSIESFETSIQIPNLISNQIATQLNKNNAKKANKQLNRIVSNYSNDAINDITVVDSKSVIRSVSNVNDQGTIGQRATNSDIKKVLTSGRQISKIINDNGKYMI